jgi:transposase
MLFVGWDWASASHDVTVINDAGGVVDRWAMAHSEEAFQQTFERLAGHGSPAELPVIIERTSGLVVDRLLAAGHRVVPVHPTSFWAARPRWGASGAKSDPGDSYKLADYLRTDGHRLHCLHQLDPSLRRLQVLVRMREDHVRARTAASNELVALLEAHWPGPRHMFHRLASTIALDFLTDYPSPTAASRLGEARMAAFCRRHSYRGGKTPAELLSRLRSAPIAPVGLPAELLAAMVGAQVQLLRTLLVTIDGLDAAIKSEIGACPRAGLLSALPGVGTINLAQLLAEVGPILDRVSSAEEAAAQCGAAPVTRSSGKSTGVYFRWAANRRARKSLTAFAHNSRFQSDWANKLYTDARARGKRNPHAIRILSRAWLRVIYTCWTTQTAYDPALHHAARTSRAAAA